MSLRAMLQATRDAIRETLHLDKTGCQVTADGRPDPMCGQEFWAVHPGGASNTANNYLDERCDLQVTLTVRTGWAAQDRIGEEAILQAVDGLMAKAERVRSLLHQEYPVMDRANALIPGTAEYCELRGGTPTVNGFVEPLRFQSMTYLGPKGLDWFWAEGVSDDTTGLAVQLSFTAARRLQYYENDS
ncbi:MAG: hypothetical protein U0804_28795 [Gemmataceae bacterium]